MYYLLIYLNIYLFTVTLKKSLAHDGRNCQVSVNFNLVLFERKFISVWINETDEFVQ